MYMLKYLFNVMIFYGQVIEIVGKRFLDLIKYDSRNQTDEFIDYERMGESD